MKTLKYPTKLLDEPGQDLDDASEVLGCVRGDFDTIPEKERFPRRH